MRKLLMLTTIALFAVSFVIGALTSPVDAEIICRCECINAKAVLCCQEYVNGEWIVVCDKGCRLPGCSKGKLP